MHFLAKKLWCIKYTNTTLQNIILQVRFKQSQFNVMCHIDMDICAYRFHNSYAMKIETKITLDYT
jgi:hypothetical protein